MYKFIKIRHDIIKQCHGNYKEMKNFNYKLEIEIFRNSTQNNLGVLKVFFQGFGCPKRHPDALLAKTMALGADAIVKEISRHEWFTQSCLEYCIVGKIVSNINL